MSLQFKSPSAEFDRSWMAVDELRSKLDSRVRAVLTNQANILGHHKIPNPSPLSVSLLSDAIKQGVRYNRWHVVIWSCALAGELIYVAFSEPRRSRGIYHFPRRLGPREEVHEGLRCLRNAALHPGFAIYEPPGSTKVDTVSYVIARRSGDVTLADMLSRNWFLLHSRPIAAWAIRQLDVAGRCEIP